MADNDNEKSKGSRTEVIVALIGLVGVIGVALTENWNNIFPDKTGATVATPSQTVAAPTTVPPASPVPVIVVEGG